VLRIPALGISIAHPVQCIRSLGILTRIYGERRSLDICDLRYPRNRYIPLAQQLHPRSSLALQLLSRLLSPISCLLAIEILGPDCVSRQKFLLED
jgi:hypothetical protein